MVFYIFAFASKTINILYVFMIFYDVKSYDKCIILWSNLIYISLDIRSFNLTLFKILGSVQGFYFEGNSFLMIQDIDIVLVICVDWTDVNRNITILCESVNTMAFISNRRQNQVRLGHASTRRKKDFWRFRYS